MSRYDISQFGWSVLLLVLLLTGAVTNCQSGEIPTTDTEESVLSIDLPFDQAIEITLNGDSSSDPDNDPLTFKWRQLKGPKIQLKDADSAQPSFSTALPGDYTFELVVFDGKAYSDPAQVTVRVVRPNRRPIARIKIPPLTTLSEKNKSESDLLADNSLLSTLTQSEETSTLSDIGDAPQINSIPLATAKVATQSAMSIDVAQESSAQILLPTTPVENTIPTTTQVNLVQTNPISLDIIDINSLATINTPEQPDNFTVTTTTESTQSAWDNIPIISLIDSQTTAESPVADSPAALSTTATAIRIDNTEVELPVGIAAMLPPNTATTREPLPAVSITGERILTLGAKAEYSPKISDFEIPFDNFIWRQLEGPVIFTKPQEQKTISLTAEKQGKYVFELTAWRGDLCSLPSTVTVVVIAEDPAKSPNYAITSESRTKMAADDSVSMENSNSLYSIDDSKHSAKSVILPVEKPSAKISTNGRQTAATISAFPARKRTR